MGTIRISPVLETGRVSGHVTARVDFHPASASSGKTVIMAFEDGHDHVRVVYENGSVRLESSIGGSAGANDIVTQTNYNRVNKPETRLGPAHQDASHAYGVLDRADAAERITKAAAAANEIDHLLAEDRWIGGTGSGHVTLLSYTRDNMSVKTGQLHYEREYFDEVFTNYGAGNVEGHINLCYLDLLVGAGEYDCDDETWELFGQTLCETWKQRAQYLFPEKSFLTKFVWYSDDGNPGVTLYQTKYSSKEAD